MELGREGGREWLLVGGRKRCLVERRGLRVAEKAEHAEIVVNA